jgi:hypothetical protein
MLERFLMFLDYWPLLNLDFVIKDAHLGLLTNLHNMFLHDLDVMTLQGRSHHCKKKPSVSDDS